MSNNPRQRIRRNETCYRGKGSSFTIRNEEHGIFMDDGNIISRERQVTPLIQGIVPHEAKDVAGQCQSCFEFTTKLIICDQCRQVVCLPCSRKKDDMTVCPLCFNYLKHRKWILIVKKLFIDPFVERVR
ncbi:MAG: hypothetical protein KAR42_04815 [candidate division Zixibacteria bacterium]|nr:hypothetical protein [candidate division Zixibacteria bacterium]